METLHTIRKWLDKIVGTINGSCRKLSDYHKIHI